MTNTFAQGEVIRQYLNTGTTPEVLYRHIPKSYLEITVIWICNVAGKNQNADVSLWFNKGGGATPVFDDTTALIKEETISGGDFIVLQSPTPSAFIMMGQDDVLGIQADAVGRINVTIWGVTAATADPSTTIRNT